MSFHVVLALAAVLVTSSCASLGQFARAILSRCDFLKFPDSRAPFASPGPACGSRLAARRSGLWTRISNPNPVGLTLSTLRAEVSLDGTRAATGDFPLGLPLTAGGQSDVPLDLSIDFADLPGLADVLRRAVGNQQVPYEVDGTFSIDVGALGRPSFGPMRLFQGRLGR